MHTGPVARLWPGAPRWGWACCCRIPAHRWDPKVGWGGQDIAMLNPLPAWGRQRGPPACHAQDAPHPGSTTAHPAGRGCQRAQTPGGAVSPTRLCPPGQPLPPWAPDPHLWWGCVVLNQQGYWKAHKPPPPRGTTQTPHVGPSTLPDSLGSQRGVHTATCIGPGRRPSLTPREVTGVPSALVKSSLTPQHGEALTCASSPLATTLTCVRAAPGQCTAGAQYMLARCAHTPGLGVQPRCRPPFAKDHALPPSPSSSHGTALNDQCPEWQPWDPTPKLPWVPQAALVLIRNHRKSRHAQPALCS